MVITDDSDERALIEAAQADPARFADLYESHFHRVYAYVIRRTGSRAEAEDITSEVFERALVNLKRFEGRGVPPVRRPDGRRAGRDGHHLVHRAAGMNQ